MRPRSIFPEARDRLLAVALGLKAEETPFPWQRAVFSELLEGRVPRALDLPTGLGKTSVMALWLLARASGAPLPRRLVYVVDRRAVVDQATDEAERLARFVAAQPELQTALAVAAELPISTLRGQHADNRRWLDNPSSTAIVVGTVDMVGSRLLFEGYRCSRRMRPYQAAVLAMDSLIVLDEAHLVQPFERLLEAVTNRDTATPTLGALQPEDRQRLPTIRLLSLSATGAQVGSHSSCSLGPADLEHPVVARRVNARKILLIRDAIDPEQQKLAAVVAEEVWRLSQAQKEPKRYIIFCDRREDARKVREALLGQAKACHCEIAGPELFVGARRVHEREEAARWLKEHGFLSGSGRKPAKPAFLVATSAGEVGVDLDADHMVSDLVPWERMVQRLGRVNRRGDGEATVIVVPASPDKATQDSIEKVRRSEQQTSRGSDADGEDGARQAKGIDLRRAHRFRRLELTKQALEKLDRNAAGANASPNSLETLRRNEPDLLSHASTPSPLYPALTRAHLESWSMTSLGAHASRPEVEPWLRGWVDDDEPQTTVIWRRHLPVRAASTRQPTRREIDAFFDAAEPHLTELLEADTADVVEWLIARAVAASRTIESESGHEERGTETEAGLVHDRSRPGGGDVVAFLLDSSDELVRSYELNDLQSADRRAREDLEQALRNHILVVDERLGGLAGGLLDKASSSADDVSILRDATGVDDSFPFRVSEAASVDRDPGQGWREELRFVVSRDTSGDPSLWLAVDTRLVLSAMTEEGRAVGRAQTLADHQSWAEQEAYSLADRLGLSREDRDLLGLAALLHDEGKRSSRWQLAFKAPRDGGPWGKTRSSPNLALLDGYRHEFGSIPYAERHPRVRELPPERRDLLLHLIASHHGGGRPSIAVAGCEDAPPTALRARAEQAALRFCRLEAQWGPWGLVWWELLLRAADQRASRLNDEQGRQRG